MSGKVRRWAELKTTDFAKRADARIAILPVAAVEQHGPHLPLGTDSFILEAILTRLEGIWAGKSDILVLPLQMIGDSTEHTDFPGTLSLDAETLIESWTAIGEAVADAGIRKLAIVNSHGGQPQIVDIAAQRLRAEREMLVARINTFLLGVPEGLFPADELAYGYHGGEMETSMMLSIAPHLVEMERAKNFTNSAKQMARTNRILRAEGAAGIAWQAQDLNPEGVMGNAKAADAKRGDALLDHLAAHLADALEDMAKFRLTNLRGGQK